MKYPTTDIPPVTEYEGRKIIRGDLIPGGLKRPVLERVLCQIEADTIVYAADGYGSAGEALALACAATKKRLHLLLPDVGWPESATFKRSLAHEHVTAEIVENTQQQIDLILPAREWAKTHEAYDMAIGCQGLEFEREMAVYMGQIWEENHLQKDAETWYAAGSGTLGRVLKSSMPALKLGIANLGFPQLSLDHHTVQVFNISDSQSRDCPFDVNPDYDAKMWPAIKTIASPGAVIINYAA